MLYVSEFWDIFRNPGSGTYDFTGFLELHHPFFNLSSHFHHKFHL